MEEKYKCMHCGIEIDYAPEFCCSGKDCNCQGLPIEPNLCAKCWDKLLGSENLD